MKKFFGQLWMDDQGALISTEFLFVATILVIGIVVGLANLRDAVNAELTQLGDAVLALNQTYTVSGTSGNSSSTTGSEASVTTSQLTQPAPVTPNPSVISVTP